MTDRPHVLFLLTDQQSPHVLGCANNPYLRTPAQDALAASGCICASAYAASPLCVPSRMALLTATLPQTTGVIHNHHALPSSQPTIAHAMAAAGYHALLCGRMHFVGPDQQHGFRERLVGDHGGCGTAPSEIPMGPFDGCTGQDGATLAKSGGGWSSVLAYDTAVRDAAIERITQHHGAQPLFMTVGFYGPHNPYVCDNHRFQELLATLPPITEEDIAAWQQLDHPAIAHWRKERNLTNLDPVTLQRARAAYYGACEIIDQHIGQIVNAARAQFGDNLLIISASDHGDMAGERGMFWKSTFFEGSVGVPLIWNWPGHIPTQVMHTPVSLLDLGPTLCGLIDAPHIPAAEGNDWSAALRSGTEPSNNDVFSTLSDRRCGESAMIRRGPWKLVLHHGHGEGELYNLEHDPQERENRWAQPAVAAVQGELQKALQARWDGAAMAAAAARSNEQLALIRSAAHQHPEPMPPSWHNPPTDYHLHH